MYNSLSQKVHLDRSLGKLGLSIIGGSEHTTRVFGEGKPGIYVSNVGKIIVFLFIYLCEILVFL